MIYSPKHVAPRQVDTVMTQIDIAPTVLGLLGMSYEAPFFGIDTLHEPPDYTRIALFSHNHDGTYFDTAADLLKAHHYE